MNPGLGVVVNLIANIFEECDVNGFDFHSYLLSTIDWIAICIDYWLDPYTH